MKAHKAKNFVLAIEFTLALNYIFTLRVLAIFRY